jgi:integrase/recombinase XerD
MSQHLAAVLKAWLEEFIVHMNLAGYSPRSQYGYRYDLLLFVSWVAEQDALDVPGDLTQARLEQYQMHLMLRPTLQNKFQHPRSLSAATRNRHLAELRSFFRFLKRTCKLLSNPSTELEQTRQIKRLPKAILSVPEIARFLQVIPKDTPVGLRDWAAVEVLYGTGIRRIELLGLNLTDLRLSEGLVQVLGKGNKERVLPLGKAAQVALDRYLREGRPQLARERHGALWLSVFRGGRVSEKELRLNLKGYARQAGIKKGIGYHIFRHTMATHLLRGGADLRSIQTMLGHTQLNTTAIYTRVEVSDLQKTIQRCHPREQDTTENPADPA